MKQISSDAFLKAVIAAKRKNPQYQIRYLAFTIHKEGDAFKGNVAARNASFMAWIADRKADYRKAFPDMVPGDTIANQEHFTNFIVSGWWLEGAE